MNKITTSILAGVALAAIAAAPASADNGIFKNLTTTLPTTFSFGPGNITYSLVNAPVSYTVGTGQSAVATTGLLSISGGVLASGPQYSYTGSSLTFTPDAVQTGGGTGFVTNPFTDTGSTGVTLFNGFTSIQNIGGTLSNGDQLQLTYAPPVPEASTLISFGALLALGGLAVLRRKSVARAS